MATRKTTLMLDDALIAEFKIRAARAGRSLSSMVAEAMKAYDAKPPIQPRPERWEIKVLGRGGWIAPMEPHHGAALLEFMDRPDNLGEVVDQVEKAG